MKYNTLASLATLAPAALGQILSGFNYGSVDSANNPITQQQFSTLFNDAQNLQGTSGFPAARLFTMIQGGTQTTPTEAIPAAIQNKTPLLLGLFISGGQSELDSEITAMKAAVTQYGSAFTDLVVGISCGSEDLYRITPTALMNDPSSVGLGPDVVSSFIGQVRGNLTGGLSGKPLGHVDTWTAWVNQTNAAVIQAVDFIGTDAYPYFQTAFANGIDNGAELFFEAYNATVGVAGGKPVWITETGWPVSGATMNQAVASPQNAQTYWDQVACQVFGKINTFWYTLQDAAPNTPNPSFGVIGAAGGTTPLYNLTCPNGSSGSKPSGSSSQAPSSMASSMAAPSGGKSGSSAPMSSAPAQSSGSGGSGSGNGGTVTSQVTVYTTVCPTTYTSGGVVKSTMVTSAVTAPVGGGSGSSSVNTPQPAGPQSSAPAPSASSGGKACPTNLSGTYEYPHLIVPVDSSNPSKAAGTSYNGTISSTVSSLFNFDIPTADQGKTCSLVFLLPQQSQLQTSSFTLSGVGGIDVKGLQTPATQQTSYSNIGGTTQDYGGPASVTPGNGYVIASGACPAGKTVGYQVSATGSLALNYFQDYNPSPIGLYVTVC